MRGKAAFRLQVDAIRPARLSGSEGVMLTKTKTNSPRLVDWEGRMRGIIDSLPVRFTSQYLFWHGEGNRYHNMANRFLRIRGQANRQHLKLDPKATPITMTFHGFRHLHAIQWLRREGRDRLPTLSLRLGHDSIKTTEWYLKNLSADGTTKSATAKTVV